MDDGERRERILQLGASPEFQAAIRTHVGPDAVDSLERHLSRCRNARFTVAVLGQQGVGKSSLINALLRRPLLPAGAERTTDIVRVDFPAGAGPDGRGPGIVLADTPGYGAANPEPELTTREFLPEVSAAVFVFATTPPLLRPDLQFLRQVRRYCRRFFFVQTVGGESPDQVEQSRKYNARQLHELLGREFGGGIYPVDIQAALAAPDEAAYAASGARPLADDLTAFIAHGPFALSLRDAHLAVLTAAWGIRHALEERRPQLEATLARAQTRARTDLEQAAAVAQTAAIRLQQTLAAFQQDLRLAERDWVQHLSTAAHRVEVDLTDLIGQGSCTKPILEEKAGVLWQIACRELEAGLNLKGDQLSDRLHRQLNTIGQPYGAGAMQVQSTPRPAPDLGCATASGTHGSPFTLSSPTHLDLSRYADLFTNGAREACWARAQAFFDQLSAWAITEVAAAQQVVEAGKERAAQAAQHRLQAAQRSQGEWDQLGMQVQANDARLAELHALSAEALL